MPVKTGQPLPTGAQGRTRQEVPIFRGGQWHSIVDTVTCEYEFTLDWEAEGLSPAQGRTSLLAWPVDPVPLLLGHAFLDCAATDEGLYRKAVAKQTGDRRFCIRIGAGTGRTPPLPPSSWPAEKLLQAMHGFISAEGMWDDTGCFHRAGVFDPHSGKLLARAEDIGRHNCIDRLAGWSVLHATALEDKALLTSARLTASLCAKALRAGFRLLISRSAVTTGAIAMARQADATLVGFARTGENRFTVFADSPGRLAPCPRLEGTP